MTPEITRSISFLDQLRGTIERLEKERDDAQATIRELEAKSAKMREALRLARNCIIDGLNTRFALDEAQHALSSDCGKGWFPKSELELTIAIERSLISLIVMTGNNVAHNTDCPCWICKVDQGLRNNVARLERLTKDNAS